MIPHIIKDTSITVFVDGQQTTVLKEHPNYQPLRDALVRGDWEEAKSVLTRDIRTINDFSLGQLRVEHGQVFYRELEFSANLAERVLAMHKEGADFSTMVNFLEKLMQNPRRSVILELYDFLASGDMPITPDGDFLAYKVVRADYMDLRTGKLDNSPGKTVEEPRYLVDDNRTNVCSKGLHFAALSYLPKYACVENNRVVVVKVNPADVVAIPDDYNFTKGRACRYEVIGEVDISDGSVFRKQVHTSEDFKTLPKVNALPNRDPVTGRFVAKKNSAVKKQETGLLRDPITGRFISGKKS
jgi:hypothetical protein